jgi:hypothetical protein
VFALVLLVIVIRRLPAEECESSLHLYLDGTPERDLVIGVAIGASLLIGIAAANRWAAIRRRDGQATTAAPELLAAVTVVLGAVGLIGLEPLRNAFYVVGVFGILAAVIGFFAVLVMRLKKVELEDAGHGLFVYLGASAFFLYPYAAMISLHFSAHPFCGFDR